MPDTYYWSGGQRVPLVRREDLVAVRFRAPERALRGLSSASLARRLRDYPVVAERPDVGLTLLRVPLTRGAVPAAQDLRGDAEVEMVTPVYSFEGSEEPILVTDEIVCQFKAGVTRTAQEELHRRFHATVRGTLDFAPNGFVLGVDVNGGENPIEVANAYMESGACEFAHPDFVKPRAPKAAARVSRRVELLAPLRHADERIVAAARGPRGAGGSREDSRSGSGTSRTRPARGSLSAGSGSRSRSGRQSPAAVKRVPSLLAREWHLRNTGQSGGTKGADARVLEAWKTTRGTPSVVVAVIDDGFDLGHPDFGPAGRIITPWDVRTGTPDPSPRNADENHGTCVLGVAGSGGLGSGVLGIAPLASLLPVRLDGGERLEAQAIAYAARAGASVVNCSWGPPDGAWWNPADPLHARRAPLPDVVAAAMRFAVGSGGREGRGCVLVWAAGNGNESISNDGYASAPYVIAVAATNHDDRRSAYSDHGPEVALAAPSSDVDAVRGTIGGIYTTDRRGPSGYAHNRDYTDAFGGTSSAAPLVAGVVALVLAVNPELTRDEVKAILFATADRVDPASPTWITRDGVARSDHYGAGRVNAARAVAEAARKAKGGAGATPRRRR